MRNPVVAIFDEGKERDVIFQDGSTITQFYSETLKMWVCIPDDDEEGEG